MKRIVFIILVTGTNIANDANAQTLRLISRKSVRLNRKIDLESNSLVKDSTGRVKQNESKQLSVPGFIIYGQ